MVFVSRSHRPALVGRATLQSEEGVAESCPTVVVVANPKGPRFVTGASYCTFLRIQFGKRHRETPSSIQAAGVASSAAGGGAWNKGVAALNYSFYSY